MPTNRNGCQRHFSEPSCHADENGPSLGSSQNSFEERCVDPPEEEEHTAVQQAHPEDLNGQDAESIGFIPGTAEASGGALTCSLCAPTGRCRSFVCCVLTCGLYRVCRGSPLSLCVAPGESSPVEPEKVSLRAWKPGSNEEQAEEEEEEEEDEGDAWLEDLHIGGVKVDGAKDDRNVVTVAPAAHSLPRTPGGAGDQQPVRLSFYDSLNLSDDRVEEGGGEDVDSLIHKKLLELYSEYQIEELARCTTDSVFLRKSKEIDLLINSLAEEHKMDEQEAESRLVRGIIRISTRKSKKRGPLYVRRERTLSDSGNETMRDSDSCSFSNNNDYKSNPNFQISEVTHSDMYARKMRQNNKGHSPTYTDTVSSGVSLSRTPVRT